MWSRSVALALPRENGPTICLMFAPTKPLRTIVFSSHASASATLTVQRVPSPFGSRLAETFVIKPRKTGVVTL